MTDWVRADDEKCELPRERSPGEAIVETGMRDQRRIGAPDQIEYEIQGSKHQYAPNACNPKNYLCELHLTCPLRLIHCHISHPRRIYARAYLVSTYDVRSAHDRY